MSEIKFACPVCGQHIRCESTKSGSQMECPTCFRKLVVPQASADEASKLVLTAAAVQSRPVPGPRPEETAPVRPARDRTTLVFVVGVVLLAAAAGAVVALRDKLFKPAQGPVSANTNAPGAGVTSAPVVFVLAAPGSETNWTLNLAGQAMPEAPASGRLNGRAFALERASAQGGTLTFRQGLKTPAETSFTVYLFARQGEDLARQTVNIESNWTNPPKIVLRWKDQQQQPITRTYRQGYAMRIEFGAVANGRLPGRIYLCVPDDARSYVAGSFEAEIRKPTPPKPPRTSQPATAPKR